MVRMRSHVMAARTLLSALAAMVLMLSTGCARDPQDDSLSAQDVYGSYSPGHGATEVPSVATGDTGRSPFDDYFLDAEQMRVVQQARITLTTQCMEDKGLTYSADIDAVMSTIHASGLETAIWGPVDMEQAQRDGYHPRPSQTSASQNASASSARQQPGYIDALVNDENTGCDDLAYAELGYDNEWFSQIATYDAVRAAANESAVADPEAVHLIMDWSACMSRKGYEADDPRSLVKRYADGARGGTPDAQERQTAVADVECKIETSFVTGVTTVIQRHEAQAVTANQATMDTVQRLSSQIFERAQEVLAS